MSGLLCGIFGNSKRQCVVKACQIYVLFKSLKRGCGFSAVYKMKVIYPINAKGY